MKAQALTVINILALACAVALVSPLAVSAAPDDKAAATAATEDIISMKDGRVLRGQIISENRDQIIFEYRDPQFSFTTKMTLSMDQVALIQRDQPKAAGGSSEPPGPKTQDQPSGPAQPSPRPTASKSKNATPEATYGAARILSDDPSVPLIYIVPMRGQVGTDMNAVIYEDVAKDIKAKKPDIVVIRMESRDYDDVFTSFFDGPGNPVDKEEISLLDFDEMYKLADLFHDDLRDFRQVVWIHDSQGMSSNLALTWSNLYMTPYSRLGGLNMVLDQSGAKKWQDKDIRAKMMAAATGKAKGLVEYGGYSYALSDAMMDPEFFLSASWRGRDVDWRLATDGEIIVDGSKDHTASFYAKDAEDFCISDGTADNLDDLALLLGVREYRVDDGSATKLVDDYISDWRRALEEVKATWQEYQQNTRWAEGDEAVKYLGKAKSNLERILKLIEAYKAVEIRTTMGGLSKLRLMRDIEVLKERLRQLREQQKNRDRGGRGGGGGGGGSIGGGGGGGS